MVALNSGLALPWNQNNPARQIPAITTMRATRERRPPGWYWKDMALGFPGWVCKTRKTDFSRLLRIEVPTEFSQFLTSPKF